MKNARGQITKASLKALEGRLLPLVGRRTTKDHRPLTSGASQAVACPSAVRDDEAENNRGNRPTAHALHLHLSARGLMYSFDTKGFIEETSKTEGVIHLPRFGSSEPNLVDLTPKIKARSVREKKTWTPTKSMLEIILV
jgi:hypothetical protein